MTLDLSAFANAMSDAHAAMAEAMGCPGWTYRDIPWCTSSVWDQFLEIAGDSNCKVLVMTKKGDDRRGQVLISPDGMTRLKERVRSA